MPSQNLYFIALVPPKDISDEVTAFRNDFALNYNSKAALKNMPHITLKAPFKIDAAKHTEVLSWFANLPVGEKSFEVELKDFDVFDNPKNPVVFVHPVVTAAMANVQKAVINDFEAAFAEIALHFSERNFKPHMTIAYRDLAYAEFNSAWHVYKHKKYTARFIAERLYLLKHNGKEWLIVAERFL
ncbi:2'-5' RNA ligase family protein [Flavobacterium subsaxonicum]|uniref:2'-5' RNA ligase n=1 Tax=Flavobacterium subsaxonicum WB 4.1-42 = DSM 21790 TaxID=1121898 RepID=A0A0A2MHX1_9FLAO|nr:2'-5' RNA ligase family protein [Flavobacterium subsaxonicum]KGO91063.1 hypothetical protein Q766_19860 [Flavobacterium subsaxonicum WB 4.1-42 = DSM 21790]